MSPSVHRNKKHYRRKCFRIVAMLLPAIAVLGIIQWTLGSRGWDLLAGLLSIGMIGLVFLLIGTLLGILRGRPLTIKDWGESFSESDDFSKRVLFPYDDLTSPYYDDSYRTPDD
ncbi:MAG: hypothetical protein ACE5HN_04785 [Nitrospiria bacterium]